MSGQQQRRLAYIECVRGYAILLVILSHATYLFPGLPYPVHRVTVLGWHGVQLFFLASAVTLMMSWHHEKSRDGAVDVAGFFLRRFFRIAPAYYLASVLYFWLEPPPGGFDPIQAAATYLFINVWHPTFADVVPGGWSVVPGSWSIGVEFTFYALFPLLATAITTLFRSVVLLVVVLLLGATVNCLVFPALQATIGSIPADNFLYFWFPNQMSVFALGLCLFFLLDRHRGRSSPLSAYPALAAAASLTLAAGTAFIRMPHWLDIRDPSPPTFMLISLTFMMFILALAQSPPGIFVNRPAALLGRVSFSAYLLHAALLKILSDQPLLQNYRRTSGWPAIPAFAFAIVGIVAIVLAGSWCVYRVVETPMIGLGKTLIRHRRAALS